MSGGKLAGPDHGLFNAKQSFLVSLSSTPTIVGPSYSAAMPLSACVAASWSGDR